MTFARLDHIVLQVPEIENAHARLLALGFETAWPIGRTWPHGPTSGIALGGINLELLQPDEAPPEAPHLAELVFAPRSETDLPSIGEVVRKIEADPEKLAARGFPAHLRSEPQRICTNAFPGADSPWPHFACAYAPLLDDALAAERFALPYGRVQEVEVGPLEVRSRFVAPPHTPDLARFLSDLRVETGPGLRAGCDRVLLGEVALDLRRLTIES